MKKKVFAFCVFIVFSFCFLQIRFFLTDNFQMRKLLLQANDSQKEAVSQPKDIENVLSQPFYYFAKGHHAYAFISEDGKYILKFLRAIKFQRPFIDSWFLSFAKQKKHPQKKRLHFIMKSHELASYPLQEQTAVYYLHFHKTEVLQKPICLIDKMHRRFYLDANNFCYVVQNKVELFEEILPELVKKKDDETIKDMIHAYFTVIFLRCQKNIMNKDRGGWGRNYGVIEGCNRAYEIDIGSYTVMENLNTSQKTFEEIEQCSRDFRKWIQSHVPHLVGFFDKTMKQVAIANHL